MSAEPLDGMQGRQPMLFGDPLPVPRSELHIVSSITGHVLACFSHRFELLVDQVRSVSIPSRTSWS